MHQSKTVPKNNEGHLVRVINFSPYTLTMGGENQDTERASEEVTVVVNIRIKPGCEKDYDEWLGRFLILERKVHGYLGTITIMETALGIIAGLVTRCTIEVEKRLTGWSK